MCHANPTWGAPRIHGELLRLGIAIAEATVGHYMVRRRPPPSQTWRTFLTNHIGQLVSVDFFVVPTLTFRVLFVFVVLAHDRRQILHVNVTGYPTAAWTAQQIRNAFPWDTAPRFLLRDRDGTYGHNFRACLEAMEIDEVLTAPQSPWQNPYVDRLIGSMRRECVDRREFDQVASLRVEGVSISATARVTGHSRTTIARWLERASTAAACFNHRLLRDFDVIELQADERCTFIGSKRRTLWLFATIEVCSRLWAGSVLGRRSHRNTKAAINDVILRGRHVGCPLIATDGFEYYVGVMVRLLGSACVYGGLH